MDKSKLINVVPVSRTRVHKYDASCMLLRYTENQKLDSVNYGKESGSSRILRFYAPAVKELGLKLGQRYGAMLDPDKGFFCLYPDENGIYALTAVDGKDYVDGEGLQISNFKGFCRYVGLPVKTAIRFKPSIDDDLDLKFTFPVDTDWVEPEQ